MSAPWGVEFKENIIFRVSNDFVERFSDNDLNWLVVGSWNIIRLEEFLKLLVGPVFDE